VKQSALVAALLAVGLLTPSSAGGAESSRREIAFPTYNQGNDVPSALTSGRLVNRRGCLRLAEGNGRSTMLIWPESMELVESLLATKIVKANGSSVQVGDRVRVGGGNIPSRLAKRLAEIPPRCQIRPYWMVGSIGPLSSA
jgi:hypothetical protein